VVELVEERLGALGYRVAFQSFPLPKGGWSNNVIAEPEGAGPAQVLVVAHHDGVRQGPAANDNGSGVAVLLEVARAFRGRAPVTFAALGAEERVETGSDLHLGSVALLESLGKKERELLRLVLSLDMVGYGPTLNVRGLEPVPNASARQALSAARRLGISATYLRDSGQSDHAEFTRGGVAAAWLQWRWDPCWHTACDTPDRVKAWKLSAAARLAIATVRGALDEP
jgi:Zn-dependent M28 family amino/carboxypeptidase